MDPDDPNLLLPTIDGNLHIPILGQGVFVLGDLVAFGKVWIKIVLPGKEAERQDFTMTCQGHLNGEFYRLDIEYWKGTGLSRTNRAGMGIGLASKGSRTSAENFRPSYQLSMNLQTDNRFIIPYFSCVILFFRADCNGIYTHSIYPLSY
jgi:hypothetical protein